MTIVSCPRCRDEVTVPAKASRRAIVRCPLCLEEYSLAEALADMPPALIVVEDAGAGEEALTPAGTATAEAGGMYQVAGGVFDSSPPVGATVSPARPAARPAPRPKRKEKSAIVELIKVVLGGLVGLSLGYVVLLWVFDMDPAELGPKVSPYAPWIVPAQFRGKAPSGLATEGTEGLATAMTSDSSGSSSPTKSEKTKSDNANESGTIVANPAVEEALKSGELDENVKKKKRFPGAGGRAQRAQVEEPATDVPAADAPPENPLNLEPDLNIGPLVPSSIPKPADEPPPPPAESTTTPEPEPTTTDATPSRPTSADLQTAIDKATDTLTRLDATPRDQKEPRQKLYSELYDDCSEVGRIASHLDPMSPEVQQLAQSLDNLLGTFAANEGKVSAIRHLATQNLPDRAHDQGIMLTGAVKDFRSAGFVHEMEIETSPLNMTTARIICRSDPQQFCRIGDGLMLVGRIVEDPQKNLAGYEGNAKRVVFLGYAVPIPKGAPPGE